VCVEVLQEAQKAEESFEDSRVKLRRNNVIEGAGKDSSRRARRGKKTKVEAFGHSGKFFQVW
jgi:hypothetical protein